MKGTATVLGIGALILTMTGMILSGFNAVNNKVDANTSDDTLTKTSLARIGQATDDLSANVSEIKAEVNQLYRDNGHNPNTLISQKP